MSELSEGLESLDYWRSRRNTLAWYRFGGRREAKEMAERWEQRVRAAVFTERGVSLRLRASAALALARMSVGRGRPRALLRLAGAAAVTMLALPFVATVALLTLIF